jgi:hypothetical protein
MKNVFRHYFRPRTGDFEVLWTNALFSFDASVFLNVYGYSRDTREELVSFLEKNADRLRLPYQFGLEFARNRCSTIMKQVHNYRAVENVLIQIRKQQLTPHHHHPYLSEPHLRNYDDILSGLAHSREELRALITSDPFLDRLLVAFDGKLGPAPTETELQSLHDEAKTRYAENIPPGYADQKRKDVPDAYGDYVGWRQLIAISKQDAQNIILVI